MSFEDVWVQGTIPLVVRDDRIWFAGLIIIAANAGGAWSPIGDITTIMLWIGGQVTLNIIPAIFLPSLVCMVAPLIYLSFKIKGNMPTSMSRDKNYFKF